MQVQWLLGAARHPLLCSLHRRTVALGNRGPVVSFTFDDFPRTAFVDAGRILEAFSARGTYYVAPRLMGISNGLGDICTANDLESLLAKGHELGTQTLSHYSSFKISPEAFRQDVEQGILETKQMTGHTPTNFSYPYGHVTLGTKKHLDPVVASSRSVYAGLNGPDIDLNLLLANKLYGDITRAQRVRDLIQQNAARKRWLIFYTHDVRPNPSKYGCTPELFEFAVSEAARSGSQIVTVAQLLNQISSDTCSENAGPHKQSAPGMEKTG